jgi:transglutaminase/protease-like cytokinesis protein 3|eukprot:COSAG02_NODE_900_length_16073_cov_87.296607_7_plen_157_part_00
MEPQEVLAQRRTVCSGYAALTVALCLLCEIPAYSVTGHAKSNARIGTPSSQRLGHAWVAVHLDGRWMLSDPTWASAAIDDESMTQHERWDGSDEVADDGQAADDMGSGTESVVDDYYYLPSAAELLPTHLPENPQWQLLDTYNPPIDREQCESAYE